MEEKYHLYDQFLGEFVTFLYNGKFGKGVKVVTLNAPEWTDEDRFVYFAILNIYKACYGKFDFNLKTKFRTWMRLWMKKQVRFPVLARAHNQQEISSTGLLDKFARVIKDKNVDVYALAREVAHAYYGG